MPPVPPMPQKAAVFHFGCRLNQYEADGLKSGFRKNGYDITDNVSESDVIVLNTCTVTNKADGKNRSSIRRFHEQNPMAKIIVTGCYATTDAAEIRTMPGVYSVVNNKQKAMIADEMAPDTNDKSDKTTNGYFGYHYRERGGNARAYLKIQDGCNKSCSYCKIPRARGAGVSRCADETVEEAKHLIEQGFHEIILTGVNIGWYKDQKNNVDFYELLERLLNLDGQFYIRLTSIEPGDVNSRLAELFTHAKMAKFLHVPIQSGSKDILKLMRRGYTAKHFKNWISLVKEKVPDIHLGTDVIVGFPSESDAHFQETVDFIKEMQFSNIHIFPYSKRKETLAVDLIKDSVALEVHGSVIKDRVRELALLRDSLSFDYLKETANQAYRAIVINSKKLQIKTENYLTFDLPESGFTKNLQHGQMLVVKYTEKKNIDILHGTGEKIPKR